MKKYFSFNLKLISTSYCSVRDGEPPQGRENFSNIFTRVFQIFQFFQIIQIFQFLTKININLLIQYSVLLNKE
jgi:hypothetical protein